MSTHHFEFSMDIVHSVNGVVAFTEFMERYPESTRFVVHNHDEEVLDFLNGNPENVFVPDENSPLSDNEVWISTFYFPLHGLDFHSVSNLAQSGDETGFCTINDIPHFWIWFD